jgi:hypothetical protein
MLAERSPSRSYRSRPDLALRREDHATPQPLANDDVGPESGSSGSLMPLGIASVAKYAKSRWRFGPPGAPSPRLSRPPCRRPLQNHCTDETVNEGWLRFSSRHSRLRLPYRGPIRGNNGGVHAHHVERE